MLRRSLLPLGDLVTRAKVLLERSFPPTCDQAAVPSWEEEAHIFFLFQVVTAKPWILHITVCWWSSTVHHRAGQSERQQRVDVPGKSGGCPELASWSNTVTNPWETVSLLSKVLTEKVSLQWKALHFSICMPVGARTQWLNFNNLSRVYGIGTPLLLHANVHCRLSCITFQTLLCSLFLLSFRLAVTSRMERFCSWQSPQ